MDRAGGRRATSQHRDDDLSGFRDLSAVISRHGRLKSATAARHAALDSHVGHQGYFKSLAKYTDYVRRMHGFESAFVVAATGIRDDWLEQWQIAQRAQWLKEDMSALDGHTHSAGVASTCTPEPIYASASALLGGLYVVIGSGLGARVLATRSATIGLPVAGGNRYLTGLGETTRWGAFVRFLEAAQDINDEQMCLGALVTFEAVFKILSEPAYDDNGG